MADTHNKIKCQLDEAFLLVLRQRAEDLCGIIHVPTIRDPDPHKYQYPVSTFIPLGSSALTFVH